MDFSYSEEQQQLQDAVTRFVQGDYGFERRKQIVASPEGFSREVWSGLADLGVLAMTVPEAHGGLGYGAVETQLAMQAMGPALLVEPVLASAVIATALVRDFGDATAQDELLPAMAAGERIVVLAHEEAAARGEVARVEATARRDGEGWRLDGRKAMVLHADAADELLVSARIEGAPGDPAGVSLFRVPRGTAGVTLRSCATIDARRASDIELRDVRLPASALLGENGGALPAIERALGIGLAALCAEAVGVMQATVDATVEYLKTRQQFGRPIGSFQALQHRTADMLLHLEQARSMSLLAAMRCTSADDAGRRMALSAAKVVVGQAARFVSQQAVQLHGGMGMTDELVVSHWFKRLLAVELAFGGTDHHLQRFARLSQRAAIEAAAAA
ncbi:acyl-CoA dehydrogenase family protein [Caldimonas tepidiphila]|uniref:acyl-CoA dehydrogenase family protein n=1 Tax=Caldimonas tepidiphila TaxID=2315841 RepID=UPI000E5ACC85|nr:acyl-CoA dehydrogenase [Caldimonas tepidiphila]